jgi:hypothetical protein
MARLVAPPRGKGNLRRGGVTRAADACTQFPDAGRQGDV